MQESLLLSGDPSSTRAAHSTAVAAAGANGHATVQPTPRSTTEGSGTDATSRTSGSSAEVPASSIHMASHNNPNPAPVPHALESRTGSGPPRKNSDSTPREALASKPSSSSTNSLACRKSAAERMEHLVAVEDRHRFHLECLAEDELEDLCDVMISSEDDLLQYELHRINAEERGFLPSKGENYAVSDPFHEDEEDVEARLQRRTAAAASQTGGGFAVAAEPDEEFESFRDAAPYDAALQIERLVQPGEYSSSCSAWLMTDTLHALDITSVSAAQLKVESVSPTYMGAGKDRDDASSAGGNGDDDSDDDDDTPLLAQLGTRTNRYKAGRAHRAAEQEAGDAAEGHEDGDSNSEEPLVQNTTHGPKRPIAVGLRPAEDGRPPSAEQTDAEDEQLSPSFEFGPSRGAGRPCGGCPPETGECAEGHEDVGSSSEEPLVQNATREPKFSAGRARVTHMAEASCADGEDEEAPLTPGATQRSQRIVGPLRSNRGAPAALYEIALMSGEMENEDHDSGTVLYAASHLSSARLHERQMSMRDTVQGGGARMSSLLCSSSYLLTGSRMELEGGAAQEFTGVGAAQTHRARGLGFSKDFTRAQSDYVALRKRHTSSARSDLTASVETIRRPSTTPIGDNGDDTTHTGEDAIAAARSARAARVLRLRREKACVEQERADHARMMSAHSPASPLPVRADDENEETLDISAIRGPTRAAGRPVAVGLRPAEDGRPPSAEQTDAEDEQLSPSFEFGPTRAVGRPVAVGLRPAEDGRPPSAEQTDAEDEQLSPSFEFGPTRAVGRPVAVGLRPAEDGRPPSAEQTDAEDEQLSPSFEFGPTRAVGRPVAVGLRPAEDGRPPSAEQTDAEDEQLSPSFEFGPTRAVGRPVAVGLRPAEDGRPPSAEQTDAEDEQLSPSFEFGPSRGAGRPCGGCPPETGECAEGHEDVGSSSEEPLGLVIARRTDLYKTDHTGPEDYRTEEDEEEPNGSVNADNGDEEEELRMPALQHAPKHSTGRPTLKAVPVAATDGQQPCNSDSDSDIPVNVGFISSSTRHEPGDPPHDKAPEATDVVDDAPDNNSSDDSPIETHLVRDVPLRKAAHLMQIPPSAIQEVTGRADIDTDDVDEEEPLLSLAQLKSRVERKAQPRAALPQEAHERHSVVSTEEDEEEEATPLAQGRQRLRLAGPYPKTHHPFTKEDSCATLSEDDTDSDPIVPSTRSQRSVGMSGHPHELLIEKEEAESVDSSESEEQTPLLALIHTPRKCRQGPNRREQSFEVAEEQPNDPSTPSSTSLPLTVVYNRAQPTRANQPPPTPTICVDDEEAASNTPTRQTVHHYLIENAPTNCSTTTVAITEESTARIDRILSCEKQLHANTHDKTPNGIHATLNEHSPQRTPQMRCVHNTIIERIKRIVPQSESHQITIPHHIQAPQEHNISAPSNVAEQPLECALHQAGDEKERAGRDAVPERAMGAPGDVAEQPLECALHQAGDEKERAGRDAVPERAMGAPGDVAEQPLECALHQAGDEKE
ncbi:hypothetical protein, conserved, partial [Leishmania lindenbergi]